MKNILALEASAGSGKTFALSVRYIALLFLGANPSSIVALTFTKKAANEMKERIYETLMHLETKEAELQEVCKLVGKSKSEVLTLRQKVIEQFLHASLHVETIDAFFGKILRKFSLHLGIMPDFQTISVSDQVKLEYEFTKSIKKDKKALQTLINFMSNEQRKFQSIFELFEILYEKDDNISTKEFSKVEFPSSEKLLDKCKEIYIFLQKQKASNRAVGMFDVDDFDGLMKKTFWKYDSLDYSTFKKCYSLQLDELFLELKEEFKSYCSKKELYILGELYALFSTYKSIKTNLAKKSNELTFSDVTKLTHSLLRSGVGSDFLYFRLDSHIKHLLIDEFQDTNIMQFDILKPIIEEIVSGVGTSEKSFFYVGDTKQSIYRFRGGSKGLFNLVAQEFHVPKEAMDTNYRSDGVVVDFVNQRFKSLLENYTNQHVLSHKKESGYVEVCGCDEVENGVIEALKTLLEAKINPNDIAILCYTNSDVTRIKEAILSWDERLDVSSQSTKSIFEVREVKALVEYLKYLYFGYELCGKNTLVLLGKNFTNKLEKLAINWAKPLVGNIIEIVEFLELNGANEDLIKCIELSSGYKDIESFLFDIPRLDVASVAQEAIGIKVLTIHKSKGLEFPFVIVADKVGRDHNQSSTLLYEYEKERLKAIYVRMKHREFVDERYKKAKEKESILNQEDRLNTQYVAFTRAKNGLSIVFKNEKSSFEALRLAPIKLGQLKPLEIEQTRSQNPYKIFEPMLSFGVQEKEHVEDEESSYSLQSIYFGRALHYMLELMGSFSTNSLEEAFWGMKNRYGVFLKASELEDIKNRVRMLIDDTTFQTLIKGGVILKEQPLIFEGQKKQLDLLVEHENKCIIIDYKSSQKEYEQNETQVLFYKKALMSIKEKEVQAWLFYLQDEKIVSKNL